MFSLRFLQKHSNQIILLALFAASALGMQPAMAASVDDNEFATASKLFDTGMKDIDRSKVKLKSGIITYIPTVTDGKVLSFKILEGKKKVLSVSQAPDFGTYIWLVHPLTGLVKSKSSYAQKVGRAEWDVVGKTFKSMQTPFVDINADGKLEVIVGNFSGGAHCCSTYKIYSLDKSNKLLDTISGLDGHFVFADLDGDKKYEAIGSDMTYRYWNTCFAGSPSPTVILRPDSFGKFRMAVDLMRLPKPSAERFNKMLAESKAGIEIASKDYIPEQGATINLDPSLWKNMLELIYSGHSQQAWSLAHEAWPKGKKALFNHNPRDEKSFKAGGPDEFINALKIKMRESPYWLSLKALNSGDRGFTVLSNTPSAKTARKVMINADDCGN